MPMKLGLDCCCLGGCRCTWAGMNLTGAAAWGGAWKWGGGGGGLKGPWVGGDVEGGGGGGLLKTGNKKK